MSTFTAAIHHKYIGIDFKLAEKKNKEDLWGLRLRLALWNEL